MKFNEKGSVTMIVVVTIFFIVILLSSFLIYTSSRRRAQIAETEAISDSYDGDMDEIYETKMAEEDVGDPEGPREVDGVAIPTGFYYVGGTKDTGIVISDSINDTNMYADEEEVPADDLEGNQFVWVPVEDMSKFVRYKDFYMGSYEDISSYYEPAYTRFQYENEQAEYDEMYASVEKYHGFFVGRFEAGKETVNNVDTVVSKKDVMPWGGLPWGDDMSYPGDNGVVAKAKSMYPEGQIEGIKSSLIYGTQWDAIMLWMDPAYETQSCATDSYVINPGNERGYFGSNLPPTTCGSNDNYRVNNIYDLAGNVWEWTMEAYSSDRRVARGGGSNVEATATSTSRRSVGPVTNVSAGVRF